MLRTRRFVKTMLSAILVGLFAPVVVPHCDVVTRTLHDLVAHAHGGHFHNGHAHASQSPAHPGDGDLSHADSGRSASDHLFAGAAPVDEMCEVRDDAVLADFANTGTGSRAVAQGHMAWADLSPTASLFPSAAFASPPPIPIGRRGPPPIDHFGRNHRLLI